MTRPSHRASASRRVADWACAFDPAQADAVLRRACARSFVDTFSVAIAGRHEPAAQRALAYATSLGNEPATLWGTPHRSSIEGAALWNGIAGHVLDHDDVASVMRGHPSIALWPALIALAQARGLHGARLASAYVVGFELICKLSRAMVSAHYARGWHSTSSVGTLASTVACSHLLALDAGRCVNALGLALAQTAGTRENFGTDAKSFQAGQCNAAAVRAVLLAEAGFTASPVALDGAAGYLALYAPDVHADALHAQLDRLGQAPMELVRSGIEVKKYPLCYATHRALDGILALRAEHGLTLADVEQVTVEASQGATSPLIHDRPRSGLEAKFSMPYAMAAALADGRIGLSSFDDEQVRRDNVQDFLPRVVLREAPGTLMPRWAGLTVQCHDGRVLTRRIETLRGSAEAPLSDQELLAKTRDCLAFGRSTLDAEALFEAAKRMGDHPVAALLQAMETP